MTNNKRWYTYREKYGYARTESVVKPGRVVMVGINRGTVASVDHDRNLTKIVLDQGGVAIVLTSAIRAMRPITTS